MIFGILALALKNKTLGIIAVVSGISFTIVWLSVGLSGGYDAMIGSLMLIFITCLPDLTMGIISLNKAKNQENLASPNQINTNNDSSSLTAKLRELDSLRESGILTDEEYSEAKKNVLK